MLIAALHNFILENLWILLELFNPAMETQVFLQNTAAVTEPDVKLALLL